MKPLIKNPTLTIEFPNREVDDKTNVNLTFNHNKEAAIEKIKKWDIDNFVIVTHSIGGCIGLSLTNYFADKVAGFVGISSVVPINGNSHISCLPFSKRLIMSLILNLLVTKPPLKTFEQMFCNGLTPEQTSEIIKRFTSEAKLLYTTKVNYNNLDTKTLYVKLNKDKGFSLQIQGKRIKITLKKSALIHLKPDIYSCFSALKYSIFI